MTDVAISYAREDINRVRKIYELVEQKGFIPFWDQSIPPGRNWNQAVHAQFQSAACIIVCWSRFSIASEAVIHEAEIGRDDDKLIPLLLDDIPLKKLPLPHYASQILKLAPTGFTASVGDQIVDSLVEKLKKQKPWMHNAIRKECERTKASMRLECEHKRMHLTEMIEELEAKLSETNIEKDSLRTQARASRAELAKARATIDSTIQRFLDELGRVDTSSSQLQDSLKGLKNYLEGMKSGS